MQLQRTCKSISIERPIRWPVIDQPRVFCANCCSSDHGSVSDQRSNDDRSEKLGRGREMFSAKVGGRAPEDFNFNAGAGPTDIHRDQRDERRPRRLYLPRPGGLRRLSEQGRQQDLYASRIPRLQREPRWHRDSQPVRQQTHRSDGSIRRMGPSWIIAAPAPGPARTRRSGFNWPPT